MVTLSCLLTNIGFFFSGEFCSRVEEEEGKGCGGAEGGQAGQARSGEEMQRDGDREGGHLGRLREPPPAAGILRGCFCGLGRKNSRAGSDGVT